jgi:hypothetical protein
MPGRAWLAVGAGPILLAGCGSPDGGAAQRPDDRIDPALTAALDGQIMVDPTLKQYANAHAVRPPELPGDAFYPLAVLSAPSSACDGTLAHDPDWARRLPAAFALPDGARLRDAAGHAGPGCSIHVAEFTAVQSPAAVLDRYFGRAVRDGYSARQIGRAADQLLYGAKGGTSYVIVARPVADGSEVGLVVRTAG